jgi:DNA primase large subunit
MDPLHARYPFFTAAREAVQSSGVTLARLVEDDAPAVERGVERVERALLSGTVAPETPEAWEPRDELLSYPVARILVSLLDSRAAVRKYAAAEATTARERFTEDFAADDGDLRSVAPRRVALEDLLAEFDLADAVRPVDAGPAREAYEVDLAPYLRLMDAEWGDRWRLVNRAVADGGVRVDREDLHRLLEAAVRRRVADGLPFDVRTSPAGEDIADALEAEVAHLRGLLADRDPVPDVEAVEPELFPPCVQSLLERVRGGETLPPRARFALLAFLADLGVDADRVAEFVDVPPARLVDPEFGAAVLGDGSRAQYPMPSCATMDAVDLCVDRDDRCETVAHPVEYYAAALAAREEEDADPDAGTDAGVGAGTDADAADRA